MSKEDDRDPRDLVQRLQAGKLSRRDFVTRASAVGLSVGAIGSILAACGGDDDEAAPAPAEPAPAEPAPAEPAPAEPAPAGPTGASDEIAVEAAQQYSGITLNVNWESGLQAQDPIQFSGPLWEELTGIKINTLELDHPDLFTKAIAEHVAGSGAFDVLNIEPAWVPDLVAGGVLEQLDDFTTQYYNPADLDDYHPLYKAIGTFGGNRWGFFDDGDTLIMYYRKDIFDDMGLTPPTTWPELAQTTQAITDAMAPEVYGGTYFRNAFNQFTFLQQFQGNDGVLFEQDGMRAQINAAPGVQTLNEMLEQNKAAPPGVEANGPIEAWFQWFEGQVGTLICWPPVGRWSAGYGVGTTELEFLPDPQVVDITGYAPVPVVGQHASGFHLSVASDSPNKEAAYLFIQWMTSPAISLQRVQLPFALRDPYRLSHFNSDEYRALWPDAGEYLDALSAQADNAVLDMIMTGWQDYALAIDRAATATFGGTDPQDALNTAASEWDEITDRLGVDAQRDSYLGFLELPGSTKANTIAAGGG